MRKRIAALALVASACGGSGSPTAPAPPPPPPVASTYVLSGTISATNGGEPLAGATISAAGMSATTDAGGHYALTLPLSTPAPDFTISGPELVSHAGTFQDRGSRTVDLDALTNAFDVDYFRQFARNTSAFPELARATKHWTQDPRFYVTTVDVENKPIDPLVVRVTTEIIRNWVPVLTNNRYSAIVESGPEVATPSATRVIVKFWRNTTACDGNLPVGQGGVLVLGYDTFPCKCLSTSLPIKHRIVKHALGHALGAYDTANLSDVMHADFVSATCDKDFTPRELAAFDVLYKRPPGNLDPDVDPSSSPY